jgi:site-specific DNA recombinase
MSRIRAKKPTPGAVIYCRVSTQEQENNTSLAAQFAACAQKAQELNLPVVAAFEEIESGGLYMARPKIQAALEAIESSQADTLIVYKLDRAGRDVDALRDVRRRVEKAGGQLVFADGFNPETNATGQLMFTTLGAFAEHERAVIRERTVRGRWAVVNQGRTVQRLAPIGYHIVSHADVVRGTYQQSEVGSYILDEEGARRVRLIFETYARLKSLRGTVDALTAAGIFGKNGKPLPIASLLYILTNEIYTGRAAYGKTRRMTDESRLQKGVGIAYQIPLPRDSWRWIEAPRIITDELFSTVQTLLEEGTIKRSGRRKYLLTSLIICPHCGRRMQYNTNTRYGEAIRCPDSLRRAGESARRCESSPIPAADIEFLVIDALCYILEQPSATKDAEKRYAAERAALRSPDIHRIRVATLQKQISKLSLQEERAVKFALDTGAESFALAAKQAAEKRAPLERELSELISVAPPPQNPLPAAEAARLIIAALRDGDKETRRNILLELIDTITPSAPSRFKRNVTITLKTSPDGPIYTVSHSSPVGRNRRAVSSPPVVEIRAKQTKTV